MALNFLLDYQDREIHLSERRQDLILTKHPEIAAHLDLLGETLRAPDQVKESTRDPSVYLYYRWYTDLVDGDKYMCVVAKVSNTFPFSVITAYITDKIKRGDLVWEKSD